MQRKSCCHCSHYCPFREIVCCIVVYDTGIVSDIKISKLYAELYATKCINCLYSSLIKNIYTVKPLSNGHFGTNINSSGLSTV